MFVQYNTAISYLAMLDKLKAGCHAERWAPIFGAKLEAVHGDTKCFIFFTFLQSGMVCEMLIPLSCIVNAISSEKSCLISVFS